tara:strand:+ start:167 stop:1213 length:1047 start_codon:yes stop_codon:yes gene_type:complete
MTCSTQTRKVEPTVDNSGKRHCHGISTSKVPHQVFVDVAESLFINHHPRLSQILRDPKVLLKLCENAESELKKLAERALSIPNTGNLNSDSFALIVKYRGWVWSHLNPNEKKKMPTAVTHAWWKRNSTYDSPDSDELLDTVCRAVIYHWQQSDEAKVSIRSILRGANAFTAKPTAVALPATHAVTHPPALGAYAAPTTATLTGEVEGLLFLASGAADTPAHIPAPGQCNSSPMCTKGLLLLAAAVSADTAADTSAPGLCNTSPMSTNGSIIPVFTVLEKKDQTRTRPTDRNTKGMLQYISNRHIIHYQHRWPPTPVPVSDSPSPTTEKPPNLMTDNKFSQRLLHLEDV